MNKFVITGLISVIFLAACVTINVYFPAAAAERAASEFVGDVLGEPVEDGSLFEPVTPGRDFELLAYTPALMVISLVVQDAHAQADIEINTPQINAIKARMAQRQQNSLNDMFDAGAIGFTRDGLVAIRDRSAVSLQDRRSLEAVVADENRDRKAVYREIAVANGHPEWEGDIQETFAKEWVQKARRGWYYQNASGNWVTK
ncbi:MAG TPA: YdbL family protein [Xanthomonadales bacterium]|nr:YdbL family protein [Xanthomonadales bacterium]